MNTAPQHQAEVPWLAVLRGRFLPLERVNISFERENSQPVYGLGNTTPSGYAQHDAFLSGTIVTRREPMVGSFPSMDTTLYLYNDSEIYLFWDLTINTSVLDGPPGGHVIDFVANHYERRQR